LSITNEYIDQIIELKYSGLPQFVSAKISYLKKVYLKLISFLSNSKNNNHFGYKMYLPIKRIFFIKKTKKYILKLIKSELKNKNSKNVILEQATNILNFKEIFKYFDNVKLIVVTRDPRDIYSSMKSSRSPSSPSADVKKFTKWYKFIIEEYYNHKKNINHNYKKSILEINFEDFILNFDQEKKNILKFIDTKEINNKYDLDNSKKNVFISKNELLSYEKAYIKKNLRKYLVW